MRSAAYAVALTGLAVGSPCLHAQPVPTWNREAEAISALVIPVEGGGALYDVSCYATLHAADLSTPVDLSTTLEIRVNGTVVYARTISRTANPSGAAGCTGLPCAGEPCFCTPPPVVCECGPVVISAGTTTPLSPGDEITIILYPAPGAAPETDTADDTVTVGFQGEQLFWNRRLASVEVVPAAAAVDSFFDVIVVLCEQVRNTGGINVSSDAELLVNGTLSASMPVDLSGLVWSQCAPAACAGPCAVAGGKVGGACTTDPLLGCLCELLPVSLIFPSVSLAPGDEISIILYPAPGALPELPGFTDDDGMTLPVCPWDCDGGGDGIVSVIDLLALLAQYDPMSPAICTGGSCDYNADGCVDVIDLLKLLAHYDPAGAGCP